MNLKETLVDQITKENNRLNLHGDELLVLKGVAELTQRTLLPAITCLIEEFSKISEEIGTVALLIERSRNSKQSLRTCVGLVNQQSFRVAAFKGKVENIKSFFPSMKGEGVHWQM